MSSRKLFCLASSLLIMAFIIRASGASENAKPGLVFRVRITKLTPAQPSRILWRYGGEGMGGDGVTGEITADLPAKPNISGQEVSLKEAIQDIDLEDTPTDRIVVQGGTYNYTYLHTNVWSSFRPASTLPSKMLTLTLKGRDETKPMYGAELEFEFMFGDTLVKRFRIAGPDGHTFGLFVPAIRLTATGEPTPEYVRDLGSLRDYIERKLPPLLALPWIQRPTPKLYGILTDCSGYGQGGGYGIRTADKDTIRAECEVLKRMGVNGFRASPGFAVEGMNRVRLGGAGGAQIPMVAFADGKQPQRHPGDGCLYLPANLKNLESRCRWIADAMAREQQNSGLDSFWGLTVDEIGSIYGGAPEGKAHQGCCPYCQEGFRNFVRADGRTLEDFGAPSWDDIRSTYGYWARNYWDSLAELSARKQKAKEAMNAAAGQQMIQADKLTAPPADRRDLEAMDIILDDKAPRKDPVKEYLAANERLRQLEWEGRILYVEADKQKHRLSPAGWNLLHYYSQRFDCEVSGRVFEPMQKAIAVYNEAKRQAMARGETDTPDAKRPWLYSFALRGNTFLMGGGSLDFFDFYRRADNAFVYETSNRDPRVWEWDSYLCDVGRSLNRHMGKAFGIYVKPHRGAPIQRALTAVSRGASMIYWYTYGPEWVKGDSFGGRADLRQSIAWAGRLIAGAEEVTYGGNWAFPAEVAVVRPRTSEVWQNTASWENGKWIFQALTHAHLPVDALDEGLLMTQDLSRYKVIYVSGSHLRKDVAAKLATWVEQGGTLYTSGWGLVRDEANQPLDVLQPVLGLKTRANMDLWSGVPGYGATALGGLKKLKEAPEGAKVNSGKIVSGSFALAVGREILAPVEGSEVLASYEDGGAAAIRHRHGKGWAYVVGFYAGVEYSSDILKGNYDMSLDFRADKRSFVAGPALEAGCRPVVDASHPLIEGVLIQNPKSGKMAATLMNWAYKNGNNLVPQTNVTIRIRMPTAVSAVQSVALEQSLTMEKDGDPVLVHLPKMSEGDILLFETVP